MSRFNGTHQMGQPTPATPPEATHFEARNPERLHPLGVSAFSGLSEGIGPPRSLQCQFQVYRQGFAINDSPQSLDNAPRSTLAPATLLTKG